MKSQVSERVKEPVAPEVLELIFRQRLDHDFAINFAPITLINRAHVVMLRRRGIITAEVAKALLAAFATMEKAGAAGYTPDPRLEDPYFNYEAAVIAITGADTGGRMHIARSRNDLGATLNRLHCRDGALALSDRVHAFVAMLIERAGQFADVVMPGYTHMQPAQPSTYGFYLLGITDAFMRDSDRLDDAWPRINPQPDGRRGNDRHRLSDRPRLYHLAAWLRRPDRAHPGLRGLARFRAGAAGDLCADGNHLEPARAGFLHDGHARVPDAGIARPRRRHLQHHAAEEEPGGDGASERQECAGARRLCRGGHRNAGDQFLQHHRRQPRTAGIGRRAGALAKSLAAARDRQAQRRSRLAAAGQRLQTAIRELV